MRCVLNLKNLFELRKTIPLRARSSLARLFKAQEKWGLVDATGILWPVQLKNCAWELKSGDIIRFESHFFRPDARTMSKYDDFGYVLNIDKIFEHVENLSEWPNAIIPSPLPCEDWFEWADKESGDTRYFSSPARVRFFGIEKRNLAYKRVCSFFENRSFTQIETPTLVPSGGIENYLNTFISEYKDHRGYLWNLALPTSPEFALKKILSEGHEKIFQISRAYRNNGEISAYHEPEFLMLEWYRAGATLSNIIEDTAKLVAEIGKVLGCPWNIDKNWPIFRVDELFLKHAGIDLQKVQDRDLFYFAAREKAVSLVETDDWDSIFYKVFFECIEPFLKTQRSCFVTHYPEQMAALATKEQEKPYVLRFEGYLEGIEICNGYEELTDFCEMQIRFQHIQDRRCDIVRDLVFEKTMAFGLPPCSGNALGLDRVVAVLAGYKNISKLYAIPFLSQFGKDTVAAD